MPIILSAPAKRRTNGSRRDVLSEDARKSGYYVATYSPGDGKTRYRFFDLADMARRGVSTAEQDYFGPLNGIHTAVGLAAAKKFLNAPTKRTNGEFYAQPYEQYAQYMYSVGKQPMVAWEWAEKQQAYYAKKAAKRPTLPYAAREAARIAKEAEREAERAEKEADKARRAAERAAQRTGAKAGRAASASRGRVHAATLSAGIPLGLREAIEQTGVPRSGITLVVTPEGAVAKGVYGIMSRAAVRSILSGMGFTYMPEHKAWLLLGFFDTEHFRALADDLAEKGIDVRRVGFNPRRKNTRKAALPPMRNNGSRSVVDTVAARELELYIENERNLVGPGNTLGANVMRMLAGRIVRGTYDATKAWKAWVPLVTEGAKRYKREHGAINASKATRDAVATRLSEAFEAEVRSGGLDPMKLLGAR